MSPNRQTAALRYQTAGAVAVSECATAPMRLTEWRSAVAHALPPHGLLNPSQTAERRSGQPSSPEAHAAYRVGRCIDCRAVAYSAGRPRCNACHDAYVPHHPSRMTAATPTARPVIDAQAVN